MSGSDDSQKQSYPGKGKMGPDGNKEKSSKGGFGVSGGKNHMLTGMTASPQEPGQSASPLKGGGKWASGGSTHMFSEQEAGPQEPGVSGHSVSGGEQKFAQGGKGKDNHMFGYTGSKPAQPH